MTILSIIPEGMSLWQAIGIGAFALVLTLLIIRFALKVVWEFLTDWRTPLQKLIDSIFGR